MQGGGLKHVDEGWDKMVSHQVCTGNGRNRGQVDKKEKGESDTNLFIARLNADIEKIFSGNPVPSVAAGLPKYTQIIQPYQHGHDHSKKTCLWLKNLPEIKPTKTVELTYITTPNGHRYTKGWYNTPRNSTDRSRTFTGIARAMAKQWG